MRKLILLLLTILLISCNASILMTNGEVTKPGNSSSKDNIGRLSVMSKSNVSKPLPKRNSQTINFSSMKNENKKPNVLLLLL